MQAENTWSVYAILEKENKSNAVKSYLERKRADKTQKSKAEEEL